MPPASDLTPTSYAILGQLSLRPWGVYEMTRNVGRTLHWFWPRAESVLYAEVKRLARRGLSTVAEEPGARGRPRAIYAISEAGRRALAEWLAIEPGRSALHSEPLLRVHLAPYGTREELLAALRVARDEAEDLLRQALVIGDEFVSGRHQFQDQVHVRAILFDALWSDGLSRYLWASRSIERVEAWADIKGDAGSAGDSIELIASRLRDAPPLVGDGG